MTLILVGSSLQASIISVGGARACAVRVGVGKESISFVSGYVQPSTGVGCAEIGRALRALGDTSLKCLGMDGNGHSPVWGPSSVSANPQGILLENLLASEDFVVINAPDSPPTFMGDDNRQSWIDVTAVSIGLLEHVQNWRVEVEAGLGSDHALILWELTVQGQFQQVQRKLNWKAVNWTKFRQQLQAVPYLQGPWTFDTSDKVEEVVQ